MSVPLINRAIGSVHVAGMGPGTPIPLVGSVARDDPSRMKAGMVSVFSMGSNGFFEKESHSEGMTNGCGKLDLSLNIGDHPEYESGRGELVVTLHNRRYVDVHNASGLHQVCSISAFNRRMTMPVQRQRFGTKDSCEGMLRNFRFYGVQGIDFPGDRELNQVITFHVFGVSEYVRNYWAAAPRFDRYHQVFKSGTDVAVNDILFLLLIRMKLPSFLDSFGKRPPVAQRVFDDIPRIAKRARTTDDPWSAASISLSAADVLDEKKSSQLDDDDEKGGPEHGDYVWQLVPYVCSAGDLPPQSLYHNLLFQGDCIRVGRIIHLYGDHRDSAGRMSGRALQGLFPSDSVGGYKDALYACNRISIALGG